MTEFPAETETLAEVCDGVLAALREHGASPDSPQELYVSWRCPTIAAAEALEAGLSDAGILVGVAQPNAEAGGRGFGVAATVSVLARREHLMEALGRLSRLGAEHGATVAGVGTAR